MIPGMNDLLAPDMQKILAFLIPALIALSILVMNMSRGFSTEGTVAMVFFAAIAIYFVPTLLEVF
ncbi:hypothetical protein SAMN06297468_1205 [Altererythrobacter xiamenensis]|uniref:Uncharacterized protein n=1 Tax=Altererythrobacter xiamenensis TaxID=1316679 RepID=A0A1Y6F263_9SPHN|nr:hypothetical protein [Altererythrobacter xiamenensis]SMQ68935.1 hypothetical protein SAMN06297468_1205 [Altererythrobacter xiamenensis]